MNPIAIIRSFSLAMSLKLKLMPRTCSQAQFCMMKVHGKLSAGAIRLHTYQNHKGVTSNVIAASAATILLHPGCADVLAVTIYTMH